MSARPVPGPFAGVAGRFCLGQASPAKAPGRPFIVPLPAGDALIPLGMPQEDFDFLVHSLNRLKGRIVAV